LATLTARITDTQRDVPRYTSEELWDLWGSSHEWSSAITGASAELLAVPGYRVPDEPNAFAAARALLEALQNSPRSRKKLWHGRPLERVPSLEEHVSFPLTATTPWKSEALRLSAQGGTQALFTFPAGTRALQYSDLEWIVAGRFVVRKIRQEMDPYWKTPIVVVQLEEGTAQGASRVVREHDLGDTAYARVREPLIDERVVHSEPVMVPMGGFDEEWALIVTGGKAPPYGYLDAGRILIDVGPQLDGDPLAGLLWFKEYGKKKITQVWIDPSVQRRGVGHTLVEAYKQHVSRKIIMVGPFSPAGLAFAKRIGARIER